MMRTFCFTATFLLTGAALSAATLATDNASNSAYGDGWTTGDNGGSGFSPWTLDSTGGGGHYIGGTGQGDPSFGVFASSSGDSASAVRGFTGGALDPGQTFSIDLGHTPTVDSGQEIGLNLTDDGASVFTLKFVGGEDFWKLNDGGSDFDSAQGFSGNTSISFTFTYEGGDDYSYTFGSASGSNFTASNTLSGIDGVTMYNNGQGDGENIGYNNLSIVPEPSMALLGGLGVLGLLRRRR